MSIFSSRTKSSSILKGTTLKSRLSDLKTPSKVRFQLPHSKKIAIILKNYLKAKEVREYEQLVVLIRDSEFLDQDIEELLQEATECISLLGHELRLFVDSILSIKWAHRSQNVVASYQSFLCNLLVAHNYHTKNAIDRLVSHFIPGPEESEWPDGIPKQEDLQACLVIHSVFSVLITLVPMCKEVMLESLIHHFPFYKKNAHIHEYYLHNLLWIIEYLPQFRSDILHLIFSKLVILDAHSPREDIEKCENDLDIAEESIFMMETDKMKLMDPNALKHEQAHTLDVCLLKIFNYFIIQCYQDEELNWDKAKNLYQWMITIFDKIILPTYKIHHVQFVMFFLCSFKTSLTEAFLNYLWKKVCTPTVASVLRQTAVAYIASLVARASFVPLVMLKGTLQQMSEWIHCYISSQDTDRINFDVRTHATFYSVCQALFYIIAFRQKDLLNSKKNISFISTLHLGKIVTCPLNPLRVCQPAVVTKFAAVTRTYQLAYCYSILEHNDRNFIPCVFQTDQGTSLVSKDLVQSFFPFDPYILRQSSSKIHSLYIEYQDGISERETNKIDDAEDDFLCENTPSKKAKFSYSSSPGFKYKT